MTDFRPIFDRAATIPLLDFFAGCVLSNMARDPEMSDMCTYAYNVAEGMLAERARRMAFAALIAAAPEMYELISDMYHDCGYESDHCSVAADHITRCKKIIDDLEVGE